MEYRATLKLPVAGDPGVPPPDGIIPAVNQTFHPTKNAARQWADKVLLVSPTGSRVKIEERDWVHVEEVRAI